MSSLVPCQACGRHHRTDETACPHCQADLAYSPMRATMRNLKVGALLAFTAATAAACYGSPPPLQPSQPHPSPLGSASTTPGATGAAAPAAAKTKPKA